MNVCLCLIKSLYTLYVHSLTYLIVITCRFLLRLQTFALRGLRKQFALQKVLHAVVDLVRATLAGLIHSSCSCAGRLCLRLVAPLLTLGEGQVEILAGIDAFVIAVDVRVGRAVDSIA